MSSPQHNVLIVGCGNIAGGFDMTRSPHLPPLSHAGAYAQHGSFSIRACVEPNVEKREVFAKRWGVDKSAPNLSELKASPGEFDVISICSPTPLHHEHIAEAILLRPKVIFCEKPMTTDAARAKELIGECFACGVALFINYSRYWDPALTDVLGQLRSGRWGALRSVIGHYNKGILNNGGHMLEILVRMLGPLDLASTASVTFDFVDSDPTVAVLLTAANGKVPVYLNPGNANDFAYFELEIVCEFGVLRMQNGGMDWLVREAVDSPQFAGYRTLTQPNMVAGRYLECMARAVDEIYAHLDSQAPADDAGEIAVMVQSLCEEIRHQAICRYSKRN